MTLGRPALLLALATLFVAGSARVSNATEGEQTAGDFDHTPAASQQTHTPLPVFFVYGGGQQVARVTLKYKGAEMQDWGHIELHRVRGGWGGFIPCDDVAAGTMRYWIVGFDANGGAVATAGDRRHPYVVAIRDGSIGAPPHLPGQAAPHRCREGDNGEPPEPVAGADASDTTDESPAAKASPAGKDKDEKAAPPEDTARKRASLEMAAYNDSDHVTVFTPSVKVGVDNTSGASLSGSYLVDVVSAASVDIVSTASQRWQEVRQAGDLSGEYKPHDFGVGVGGSVSREPDYLSYGGFVTLTKDFDEKNWTITGGYGYSHDTAGRCGADGVCTPFSVFARELDRGSFNGGLSWVVDAASLASVSMDVIIENGDQSKPYRYIPMFSPAVAGAVPRGAPIGWVNAYRLPERPLEQLPLELHRAALTGRYAHRFDGSTVRLEERVYDDDWGLVASTSDARWIVDLGQRFELWPHIRFHGQSAVTFWKRAYVSGSLSGWDLPEYRTGDRELGPLVTLGAGLGARAYLGSKGRPEQFALQLAWDGMYTSFLDDLYVTDRTAMLGALTFLGEL
jgi:hypothetical protein